MEFKSNPSDVSQRTIKNLFFQQIKKLSVPEAQETFDVQFSDAWI